MKSIILGILCIALTATDGLAKDASPEAIAAAESAYLEGMKHFEAKIWTRHVYRFNRRLPRTKSTPPPMWAWAMSI